MRQYVDEGVDKQAKHRYKYLLEMSSPGSPASPENPFRVVSLGLGLPAV